MRFIRSKKTCSFIWASLFLITSNIYPHMKNLSFLFSFCFLTLTQSALFAQLSAEKPALVSFDDFKNLVAEVEPYREQRMVNLETFLAMSKEPNTIILDARSKNRYDSKHLLGAVSLPFTDFTASDLQWKIPNPETRILIYCNNNIDDDPIDFRSKMVAPPRDFGNNQKPIMLALNIPTFINLYGYGYRNIYELSELVSINDPRIKMESSIKED